MRTFLFAQPGQPISTQRDEQDNLIATVEKISSVGIANLALVQSHQINRVAGSTSHVLSFVGGGHLCFAYSVQGRLIELSGEGVGIHVGSNHEVIISPIA